MASVLPGLNDMNDILLQYGDTGLSVAPSAKVLTDVDRPLMPKSGAKSDCRRR